MQGGLVTKRIFAHVRNSKTNSNPFEHGLFEGEKVLVLSGNQDAVSVNVLNRTIMIPAKFLFPVIPSSKGQDVVVISGDRMGEVFLTRKPKADGTFPLGRRGHKGNPICTMEPSRLARCDPK